MIRLLCVFGFVAALCAGAQIKRAEFTEIIKIVSEIRDHTLKDQEEQKESCRKELALLQSQIGTLNEEVADNTDRFNAGEAGASKYTNLKAGADGKQGKAQTALDNATGKHDSKIKDLDKKKAAFDEAMKNSDEALKAIQMVVEKVKSGFTYNFLQLKALAVNVKGPRGAQLVKLLQQGPDNSETSHVIAAIEGVQQGIVADQQVAQTAHDAEFQSLTQEISAEARIMQEQQQLINELQADIDRFAANFDAATSDKNAADRTLKVSPNHGSFEGVEGLLQMRQGEHKKLTKKCSDEISGRAGELQMFEDLLRTLRELPASFVQLKSVSVVRLLGQEVMHMKSKAAKHTIMALIASGKAHGLDVAIKLIDEKIKELTLQKDSEDAEFNKGATAVNGARDDFEKAASSVEQHRGDKASANQKFAKNDGLLNKANEAHEQANLELKETTVNFKAEEKRLNDLIDHHDGTVNTSAEAIKILKNFYDQGLSGTKANKGETLIARMNSIHDRAADDLKQAQDDLKEATTEFNVSKKTLESQIGQLEDDIGGFKKARNDADAAGLKSSTSLKAAETALKAATKVLEVARKQYMQQPSYTQRQQDREREISDLKEVLVVLRQFTAKAA